MNIHDKKEVESVTLQERLRQMASIAITHPQFTDYVNNALEAALEAADALDQKDAEIERLTDELINVEQVAKDRYCTMQSEIERLREELAADQGYLKTDLLYRMKEQQAEIERLRADLDECYQDLLTETLRANTAEERNDELQAVVDAAKEYCARWHNVEHSTLKDVAEALAALEDDDE